jgi:uncharacterized membrane protein YeaQ/YmgE (transglycosylase-associated protein family)
VENRNLNRLRRSIVLTRQPLVSGGTAAVFGQGGAATGKPRRDESTFELSTQTAVAAPPRAGIHEEDTHMFGVIGWIVFGLIVGLVAKLVMPGRDPGGLIVTMLLGIVGALVGGFLGRALGLYGPGDPAGFVMSVVGAIVLLAIYRMTVRRGQATL